MLEISNTFLSWEAHTVSSISRTVMRMSRLVWESGRFSSSDVQGLAWLFNVGQGAILGVCYAVWIEYEETYNYKLPNDKLSNFIIDNSALLFWNYMLCSNPWIKHKADGCQGWGGSPTTSGNPIKNILNIAFVTFLNSSTSQIWTLLISRQYGTRCTQKVCLLTEFPRESMLMRSY